VFPAESNVNEQGKQPNLEGKICKVLHSGKLQLYLRTLH
jgi:hypothetical protein